MQLEFGESAASTVKLQIFVRYPFVRTFDLKLVRTKEFSYFRGPQNKITLKFDGLKTKINFRPYRTKICDFTVFDCGF